FDEARPGGIRRGGRRGRRAGTRRFRTFTGSERHGCQGNGREPKQYAKERACVHDALLAKAEDPRMIRVGARPTRVARAHHLGSSITHAWNLRACRCVVAIGSSKVSVTNRLAPVLRMRACRFKI